MFSFFFFVSPPTRVEAFPPHFFSGKESPSVLSEVCREGEVRGQMHGGVHVTEQSCSRPGQWAWGPPEAQLAAPPSSPAPVEPGERGCS